VVDYCCTLVSFFIRCYITYNIFNYKKVIEHFYTLYPKKESNTQVTDYLDKIDKKELEQIEQNVMEKIEEINESQYPKLMWVCNNEDFRNKCKRVVFMETCGKFLAWGNAETLEEAEKVIDVTIWGYAKDIKIKEFSVEEAIQALAEKHNLDLNEVEIKI
jgi:hypothetical protein